MPARWRRGAVGDVLTAQLGFDEFLGERVLVTVDLNTAAGTRLGRAAHAMDGVRAAAQHALHGTRRACDGADLHPTELRSSTSSGPGKQGGLRTLGIAAEYFPWPPPDDPDRAPYRGTQTGHVIGLDTTGATLFDVDLGAPVHCYPALAADANLIVGARNGTLSVIR